MKNLNEAFVHLNVGLPDDVERLKAATAPARGTSERRPAPNPALAAKSTAIDQPFRSLTWCCPKCREAGVLFPHAHPQPHHAHPADRRSRSGPPARSLRQFRRLLVDADGQSG